MIQWNVINVKKVSNNLKLRLMSALILINLRSREAMVIYSDAKKDWLGTALMKNKRVVAYTSWQLKDQVKNYPRIHPRTSSRSVCIVGLAILFVWDLNMRFIPTIRAWSTSSSRKTPTWDNIDGSSWSKTMIMKSTVT